MKCIGFRASTLVCTVTAHFCLAGCSIASPAEPLPLGPGPHLFIDDHLIAESTNLGRTTHQPEKLPEPVLRKEEPWHEQPLMYLKVLHDPDKHLFRIWYNVKNPGGGGPVTAYAYAESTDGLHWERPNLGIIEVNGSTANNLFKTGGFGPGLVVDDGPNCPDPARRYKTILFGSFVDGRVVFHRPDAPSGLCVSFSADGIHWTDYEGNPVLKWYPPDSPNFAKAVGDINDCIWDPLRHRYILIYKMYSVPGDGYGDTPAQRRLVGQSTSKDFIHWTEPRRIIVPDPEEEGEEQYYGMRPMVRGEQYIGFLRVLRDDLPADEGGPVRGIGWTELCTSHDGENWQRHREVFLDRNHEPGTWDHAMAWFGDCVTVGDKEYIYYGGYSAGHKVGDRQIGLAFLRKDGFVSRDAGAVRGYLRTPLITLDGARMTINANVEGELRVRVLDAGGRAIAGFDWDDCKPIRGDSLRHAVQWKREFASLRGKPVRLEFALRNAELYAFELAK